LYYENTFISVPPDAAIHTSNKMIKTRRLIILLSTFTAAILLIAGGCKKDSDPVQKTEYDLEVKDVLGVSGTVTFSENSGTSSIIDIVLINAPSGVHQANLYMNSVIENGAISYLLNPFDSRGKSSTILSNMNYSSLIAYDGCIRVLSGSLEPGVILAQCDIGGNVVTSTNKSYNLNQVGEFGVSGTALYEKRLNGNTLLTLTLTGMIPGEVYPATINLGSIESVGGGPVVKILSNVDGTTGKSFTNIQKLDGGTNITFSNWLVYDGYINIYKTSALTENIICQGNIGSN
jgi:hypothetical protein